MEMNISSACGYEALKKYWRRRRYQRLHSSANNKRKKLKLGGAATKRLWKLKPRPPKLQWKRLLPPIRILVNFHDAYVDMMLRLANNVGKLNNKGVFKGKKVAKDKEIVSMVSCGEEVDIRLVLEIYKRLVASSELSGF